MGKFIRYNRLEKIINKEKEKGKEIVLTGGCFDILHMGHIYLLGEAKKFGDILVVNIVNDKRVKNNKGEKRPINSAYNRAYLVSSMEWVDYATVHPSVDLGPTIELARMIKPDVIIKSTYWKSNDKKRVRELLEYNMELKRVRKSSVEISTTEIIEKISKKYSKKISA